MAERTALLRKMYRYEDGETGRSIKPGATHLIFEFVAPDKVDDELVVLETREIDLADFQAAHEDMAFCGFGHGLSQKLGDGCAGIAKKAAKDEVDPDPTRGYVDYATQLWDDLFDDLSNDVWVAETEGSGAAKTTMLFIAITNVLTESGVEHDPAVIRNKLKDESYRKSAKENPQVMLEFRKLEKARADERERKAAELAQAAVDAGEGGLDSLV